MFIFFLVIGFAFSLFYGLRWKEIWFLQENQKLTKSRWVHEAWFNFVGSAVGWSCFYILFSSLSVFSWQELITNILWQHLIVFLIGLMGITGLLPYILWSISRVIEQIVTKIFKEKI